MVTGMRDVLISGAGVAGSTLAFWLARNGFRPTVVERSPGLRSSGNPVDVRGPAVPVVTAMGVLPRLREVATRARRMRLLDADGRQVTTVAMPAAKGDEVEVPRADLAAVLHEAARDDAEYLFDDVITGLTQDEGGVEVTFDRAAPRRFDLVIGADGLHSNIRRLAFGPERDFVQPTGIYVATTALGEPVDHPEEVLIQNTPGRLVSIHPGRDKALVAFIFRSAVEGADERIVREVYGDAGWRVPELLEKFRAADDVFFDAVSVVELPRWSRGRIALVGDAASYVSLLGMGRAWRSPGRTRWRPRWARITVRLSLGTSASTGRWSRRNSVVSSGPRHCWCPGPRWGSRRATSRRGCGPRSWPRGNRDPLGWHRSAELCKSGRRVLA